MTTTLIAAMPATAHLTRETFARRLSVSLRHFDAMDNTGRIPQAVRFGRSKRWPIAEIEEWERAGCPSRQEWSARRKAKG